MMCYMSVAELCAPNVSAISYFFLLSSAAFFIKCKVSSVTEALKGFELRFIVSYRKRIVFKSSERNILFSAKKAQFKYFGF